MDKFVSTGTVRTWWWIHNWINLVSQDILRGMDSGSSTALRRGVIGPCILALLDEGPRYGLEIVRDLDAAGQLLTSQGTIYPLLNRLREAALVSSYWETPEGERARRYYRLTAAGRRELETFRADWGRFARAVDALVNPEPFPLPGAVDHDVAEGVVVP